MNHLPTNNKTCKKELGCWVAILTLLLTALVPTAEAQQTLDLEQCRQMALESNYGLRNAKEKTTATQNLEKAALWQMLPKVGFTGGYSWMQKSVNLLSDEQKERLSNIGNTAEADLSQAIHDEFNQLPFGGQIIADALDNVIANSNLSSNLNAIGSDLVNDLETDTRNVAFGVVTLTQPIYLGGKLRALYRSAQLANRLAGIEYDKKQEETLIAVDEAYWQVLSVKHKKELAQRYADLLDTLNRNVEAMVEAQVATRGDLANVRVKLNEAQMSLTKASNGLILAKMLLAQRCGIPLDTDFEVAEASPLQIGTTDSNDIDMNSVWQKRREMQMLRISDSIALQAQRVAASTLKPNVGFTGGYLFSNPNLFNGFKNEVGGTFFAGLAVNIPIAHPGGIYSLKAAKAKRRQVTYQIEEAKQMIELQVNKLNFELQLAYKKLAQAQSNLTHAEENLKLATESFHSGLCSSSDLMAAQTAWLQAQTEILDAEIEIEMNALYLRQALGD
ncbi:MAG: TolC family protein [Bacteroidales bacterium]|nr:TolC family protein [Bacteroidales bacterium]